MNDEAALHEAMIFIRRAVFFWPEMVMSGCQGNWILTIQQFPDINDSFTEKYLDGSIVLAHIKPIAVSEKSWQRSAKLS